MHLPRTRDKSKQTPSAVCKLNRLLSAECTTFNSVSFFRSLFFSRLLLLFLFFSLSHTNNYIVCINSTMSTSESRQLRITKSSRCQCQVAHATESDARFPPKISGANDRQHSTFILRFSRLTCTVATLSICAVITNNL